MIHVRDPHAAVMTGNLSSLRKAPPLAQDAAEGHVSDHQPSQPPGSALRQSVFANFRTIRLPTAAGWLDAA
jgi:hypothetical protein